MIIWKGSRVRLGGNDAAQENDLGRRGLWKRISHVGLEGLEG